VRWRTTFAGDTRLEREVIENFVRQLRVIFLDAAARREPPAR